jgi:hypothetical protein
MLGLAERGRVLDLCEAEIRAVRPPDALAATGSIPGRPDASAPRLRRRRREQPPSLAPRWCGA